MHAIVAGGGFTFTVMIMILMLWCYRVAFSMGPRGLRFAYHFRGASSALGHELGLSRRVYGIGRIYAAIEKLLFAAFFAPPVQWYLLLCTSIILDSVRRPRQNASH